MSSILKWYNYYNICRGERREERGERREERGERREERGERRERREERGERREERANSLFCLSEEHSKTFVSPTTYVVSMTKQNY